MNHHEAKRILQAWRPDSVDALDPHFREALALVETDASLRDWFTREQQANRRLHAATQTVAIPAGLRERILAARAAPPVAAESKPRRSAPWWILAAAVIVLALGVAVLWPRPRQGVADSALAAFVIDDASRPKTHGGHGHPEAELKATLKQPATRLGHQSPDFTHLHDSGCRAVKVEGRDVLEVCFRRDGLGLHYYIARREDFPGLKATEVPEIVGKPSANLVVWEDATHLYIVVTAMEPAALQKLL